MTYVEWLRVRAALKWTTIVLGAIVLIALVFRIFLFALGKDDALSFVHGMETDANSRVAHSTLPDGTRRTVIDNVKEDVHIVVDDSGYQGTRITIYESSARAKEHGPKTIVMGSLNVQSSARGGETVTTIDTNRPENFAYYAARVRPDQVARNCLRAAFERNSPAASRELRADGTLLLDPAGNA